MPVTNKIYSPSPDADTNFSATFFDQPADPNNVTATARRAVAQGQELESAISQYSACGLGANTLIRVADQLAADLAGIDPRLLPLLRDERVTDVLINGPQEVWIDRGCGLEKTDIALGSQARTAAIRMAAACGKRLDDAEPVVDATMSDGTRLHAVIAPLASPEPLVSLRTSRTKAFTLAELVARNTVAPQLAPVLDTLVQAKASTLISGATGTGKTTLLAALLGLVATNERIICIEEVSELHPNHEHVVHLQERHNNVQGKGGVPMSELVRAAMRMRPDRIVLGECRGPEVREVLSALNTGHQGGWATIHANSSADVPARLVALGALANMTEDVVSVQAAAAFDAVIQLRRRPGPAGQAAHRWVGQIASLHRQDRQLLCPPVVTVDAQGQLKYLPGWDNFAQKWGLDPHPKQSLPPLAARTSRNDNNPDDKPAYRKKASAP